jgi:3-phenylpropionate/trans-cinnamate dioxygenase ferredoxin reductase subunit
MMLGASTRTTNSHGDSQLLRAGKDERTPQLTREVSGSMSVVPGVVIVGAGHAGGSVAAFLRQYGWSGSISLLGAEPVIPYQRPPLSKAWLKGEASAESLALRPASFYWDHGIDLHLATRATSIDLGTQSVVLEDSAPIPYRHLVLALGSRLRKLQVPGANLPGVLELRTTADADRLKKALGPNKRLAVIGGGYIGLEVAASARTLGAAVTVIERESRVLARVGSPELSHFFEKTHRAKGVDILLDATVASLQGDTAGGASSVQLDDGRRIDCDVALVGVGAAAEDGLARGAGIACDEGIIVDLAARTSTPDVYAIGDCTRRPLPRYARTGRLESVPNALEQAKQAANDICGRPPPVPEVPWFWSDQYDVRLQMAGLPFDTAATVVRGDPASEQFAIFHLDSAHCLQAVEAVNASTEFMSGRILIGKRTPVDHRRLADKSVPMKEFMT